MTTKRILTQTSRIIDSSNNYNSSCNNVYVIWAHPRVDSLTGAVTKVVINELLKQGRDVLELDLYRRGFNPVLLVEDEPDWKDPQKLYSPETEALISEISDRDVAVFIFPIWWYSFPAIVKGYIERVWNYGVAYGGANLRLSAIQWIGLAADSREQFEKRGYDAMIEHHLNIGIADYLRDASRVDFIWNTLGKNMVNGDRDKFYDMIFKQAREIAINLPQ